jgi:hypothetical protein
VTFDAGSIEATLELNRLPFEQSLAVAVAEAKTATGPYALTFTAEGLTAVASQLTAIRASATAPIELSFAEAGLGPIGSEVTALRTAAEAVITVPFESNSTAVDAEVAALEVLARTGIEIPVNFDAEGSGSLTSAIVAQLIGGGAGGAVGRGGGSTGGAAAGGAAGGAAGAAGSGGGGGGAGGAAAGGAAGAAAGGSGGGGGGGWWGAFLGGTLPLFGGLGEIAVWHVALDGIVEATIALGTALVTASAAMIASAPAAEDIYNHLTAIYDVSEALGQKIPPLNNYFEQLQHAVAPGVVEAYGGALQLVNTQAGGTATIIEHVVTMFDTWIAKLDVFAASQNGANVLLKAGAGFLQQFGEFAGEVGIALDNLIKADPGTAHFLADLLVGFGKFLDIITSIPTPVLEAALALHSLYLWGGLLVTGLTNVVGWFVRFGDAIVSFATDTLPLIAANPFTWLLIAAAGLLTLTYEFGQANAAAKNFVNTMNSQLQQLTASSAIIQINTDIGELNRQIQTFPTATMNGIADSVNNSFAAAGRALHTTLNTSVSFGTQVAAVGKLVADSLGGIGNMITGAFHTAQIQNSVNLFHGEIVTLTKDQDNLFKTTGSLISQGYDYQQSLAIMNLAGVNASDTYSVMEQKVENLINGYKNLSVAGGLLQNAVNAVTFSTEFSDTQVSALTQGFTTFINLVTGGESSLVTWAQQLATIGTNAVVTGASLNGLNSQSLTLRSSFTTGITDASSYMNSLYSLAAAADIGQQGTNLLTQAGKDLVDQLLPMAKNSTQATAQLYALAQQAGYNGVDSFKALTQWVGNVHAPMTNLDSITTKLTVDSAGLTKDVQNLAAAINQNLNSAMAAAIFQATGGQKAFDNFANAVIGAHGNTTQMTTAAQQLANQLITTLGNTTQAENEFIVFAGQLGLTKTQAQQLWGQLQLIKPLNESITVTGTGAWSLTQMTGTTPKIPGVSLAAGGKITQGSTSVADDVLARVSYGETVVSAAHSAALAPVFKAVGVPGYAAGGVVGNYSGGVPGLGPWANTMYAETNQAIEQSVANAIHGALSSTFLAGGVSGNAKNVQAMLEQMAATYGWVGAQWQALNSVELREAGYNITAQNPTSGAYGLAQFINGPSEYALYGGSAATAGGQALGMLNYILQRYGTPENAWEHELAYGWYDGGGPLPPGVTIAQNSTGSTEEVLSPSERDAFVALARGSGAPNSQLSYIANLLQRLITVSQSIPMGVGNQINAQQSNTAANASFRRRYPRGGS